MIAWCAGPLCFGAGWIAAVAGTRAEPTT